MGSVEWKDTIVVNALLTSCDIKICIYIYISDFWQGIDAFICLLIRQGMACDGMPFRALVVPCRILAVFTWYGIEFIYLSNSSRRLSFRKTERTIYHGPPLYQICILN